MGTIGKRGGLGVSALDSARAILVVGTSQTRRARTLALLTEAGHRATAVATITEAKASIASDVPRLVIFDFELRDVEATDACRQIKNSNPETFILQISPRDASDVPTEIESCIDAFLIDPVDSAEMLVLVRSLLRLQKVEADLRDSEERLLLAQESAGLAILDWIIPTNTFIHSDNFADVFDLERTSPDGAVAPGTLLERIHPEDLDGFIGELSQERTTSRAFDREIRVLARDGTTRWIASRGRLFIGPDGAPERMLSLSYDVTSRKTAERTNAELASIVSSSSDAIISVDLEGMVTSWNVGAERHLGLDGATMIGRPLADALQDMETQARDAYLALLTDGDLHEIETRRTREDGSVVELWITSAPIRSAGSEVIGASLIARDVSQQKQREEHVRFLMRELTHRSKNLLAVIQAMARQSMSRDIAPQEFVKRFTDRLQGLAGSHDLLSRVDWKGASLMELIRSQLSHYMDLFGTRILLDGTDIAIRPEAAQNVGIALHELSTNAAKYGALSNDLGRVTIVWSIEGAPQRMLKLAWQEAGGPPVVAPTRRGFGHVVMDRIAGQALGGNSGIRFEPDGVVWTLEVPAAAAVFE